MKSVIMDVRFWFVKKKKGDDKQADNTPKITPAKVARRRGEASPGGFSGVKMADRLACATGGASSMS
jgi:hypothetical protein